MLKLIASEASPDEVDENGRPSIVVEEVEMSKAEIDEIRQIQAGLIIPPSDIVVTDRQFAQALAEPGEFNTITWEEAHAWGARGEIPQALMAAIGQIPDDLDRNRTIMFVSSAKDYELLHPAAIVLGQLMGWDEDRRRALWEFASTL